MADKGSQVLKLLAYVEGVVILRALLINGNKAAIQEYPQMMGNGRTGQVCFCRDLADTQPQTTSQQYRNNKLAGFIANGDQEFPAFDEISFNDFNLLQTVHDYSSFRSIVQTDKPIIFAIAVPVNIGKENRDA